MTVSAPEPYEGVGRALVSAYSAIDQSDLPNDMIRLLDRLDHKSAEKARARN